MIALDAMGGDSAPEETVRGAVLAARELGLRVVLVGAPDAIRAELAKHGATPAGIEIAAASEVIGMHEAPAQSVRQKKDASINVAMELQKRGEVRGVVSAGNTGAAMAAALLKLGRVPGIERPALSTMAPYTERGILVLDVGANVDCRPSYLVQFARMGAVYATKVLGVDDPRIGLLNIGEESSKGSELAQEVHARLLESGLRFVGNVEPNHIHLDLVDVLVTDGFTGNVAVKTTEGVADFIFRQLRASISSRLHYKLAALVLRPALLAMRSRMDYAEYGGAPLLGVDGVVIVTHGRADANAVRNALRLAGEAAESGMMGAIRDTFSRELPRPAPTSAAASSGETRA